MVCLDLTPWEVHEKIKLAAEGNAELLAKLLRSRVRVIK